jgi:hypothetical protein
MTSAVTPTYLQTLSEADRAHEIEQWRAAQTVRNRVSDPEWRDELLGALGLMDVQQPTS